MKLTYDREADAAYLYVSDDNSPGMVKKTYACDPSETGMILNIDFDGKGVILGIEVLGASYHLPKEVLANAHELTEADIPAPVKKAR
jgi:uncharacterized protein YuzE